MEDPEEAEDELPEEELLVCKIYPARTRVALLWVVAQGHHPRLAAGGGSQCRSAAAARGGSCTLLACHSVGSGLKIPDFDRFLFRIF